MSRPFQQDYYWSTAQTEFATDLSFDDARHLAALYPQCPQHGIRSFASADGLRFLGRRSPNAFQGTAAVWLRLRRAVFFCGRR